MAVKGTAAGTAAAGAGADGEETVARPEGTARGWGAANEARKRAVRAAEGAGGYSRVKSNWVIAGEGAASASAATSARTRHPRAPARRVGVGEADATTTRAREGDDADDATRVARVALKRRVIAGRSASPSRPRRGGRACAGGRWDALAVACRLRTALRRFPPLDARRRPARESRRRPRARDATTDATPGGRSTVSTVAIRRARRGVCPWRARLDPRPNR